MNLAVSFALLSLLFAGLNDVVFKRYAGKDRSRGAYVFGIGLTWSLFQAGILLTRSASLAWEGVTLFYGMFAGALLVISNLLLLEGLSNAPVSLGSTIYRLNTIGVVILSFFLLDEPFGKMKILGILCGIVAVVFLYKRDDGQNHSSLFLSALFMLIMASLFRASYGVISKVGLLEGANLDGMLLIFAVNWMVGGAIYARFRENRFSVTVKKSAYSLISGVLVFLIVNFLLLAVKYGEATVVIPIANMSFVVAMLLAMILKMEVLTLRKACAVTLAATSIFLLSWA
ncbi:MAG: EamA family transporter [Syntrophales bacterium]|nr:EamA family transporter [Syntrophales bacterium]